jgi:hypothetical protein
MLMRAIIASSPVSGSDPRLTMDRQWSGEHTRPRVYVFSVGILMLRSAGFQTCRIADFQVGSAALRPAGLETRGTADLEVCATLNTYPRVCSPELRT